MAGKQSLRSWDGRYRSPAFWLVTWFGVGLIKPAPGTWGSFAALPLVYLVAQAGHSLIVIFILLMLEMVGSLCIDRIEEKTGIHDAPEIVVDEVYGQLIAVLPIFYLSDLEPWAWPPLPLLALAFLMFRFFDILKPWPIGWIDRSVKGGYGVMLDDAAAGLCACLVMIATWYAGLWDMIL